MTLLSLPSEIIVAIYEQMSVKEILQTRQTCKRMAEISNEASIWKAQLDHYARSINEDIAKSAEGLPASELQSLVLKRFSYDHGWRRRTEPVVRNATNDIFILPGGKLLLPGGRWLLTWGGFSRNMAESRPAMARKVYAYDLDAGPEIAGPRLIFQSSKSDDATYEIRFVAAQLNYADDGTPGFVVAVASNRLAIVVNQQHWGSDIFVEIFHFGLDGQASPPLRAIELQSGPIDQLDLRDDFVLLQHGPTYEILDWRSANGSSWKRAFIRLNPAETRSRPRLSRLLPDGRLLRISGSGPRTPWIQMYLSELEGTELFYTADPNNERRPTWSLPLADDDFIIEPDFTNFSEPCHVHGETRITMRMRSIIYGLVLPDDVHDTPIIFELARFEQKYLHEIRRKSITLGIDKLVAAGGYGVVRFIPFSAAFSWPSVENRPSWKAPFIIPIGRDLEAYRFAVIPRSPNMVVDPVFGRLITGVKINPDGDWGLGPNDEWIVAVHWSVVDLTHRS